MVSSSTEGDTDAWVCPVGPATTAAAAPAPAVVGPSVAPSGVAVGVGGEGGVTGRTRIMRTHRRRRALNPQPGRLLPLYCPLNTRKPRLHSMEKQRAVSTVGQAEASA